MPFDDLWAGLMDACEQGLVSMKSDGPLRLFSYTNKCAFDKAWTPFSLMARGLILDAEAKQVVATPFTKFFNFSESMVPNQPMEPLPDEPFEVTIKCDGSLGIVFFHGGRWRVATKGSFNSEQAKWAERWLNEDRGQDYLDVLEPRHTYLFEIVYPQNRIVVSYDYEGMVLLSAYTDCGYEYPRQELFELARDAGERMVPIVECQRIEELLGIAKTLSGNEEGFVVRFQSGRRIKIKGDEYVRIHRLVSRVTPLGVFDLLVAGDDINAVAMALPEEFRRDLYAIQRILKGQMQDLIDEIETAVAKTADMTDKELGLWLRDQVEIPNQVARWIFPWRKTDMRSGSAQDKKLWTSIRPTGNVLDGYMPSSAMNRFSEELS
jgi:RNA ligase